MNLEGKTNSKKIKVGGTKGAMPKHDHSPIISDYARNNFSTEKKFQQKPSKNSDIEGIEAQQKQRNDDENDWKSPPPSNKIAKKGTKASLTVNFNNQRLIQDYKDVVTGNTYPHINKGLYLGQTTLAPKNGNEQGNTVDKPTTNTVTIHGGTQTGTIINPPDTNKINQLAFQKFIESKQFQATLAKAVAPQVSKQVSSLIAPTIDKITQIEEHVGELNSYVQENNEWQKKQTNKQDDLQQSMNQMQSSMNAILTMFKDDRDRENKNKRSATNTYEQPLKSPTRKQKVNQTNHITYTPMENINNGFFTQNDVEASNPHNMSHNTPSDESVEEAMSIYTPGEGEGQ
jgi:hypothetical protein